MIFRNIHPTVAPRVQRYPRPTEITASTTEETLHNMVSRGISTEDILRGIHENMAPRFARLLRSIGASGAVLVTGRLRWM